MVMRALMILLALCGAARADTLRILVAEGTPVVGEMIPVTLRGEYTSTITLEKLAFPDSDDYDWIQIARDRWGEESVDGLTQKVFERRLALYPRRAGPLAIGPVVHRLTVMGARSTREALDVTAPPVTVAVAPFPVDGPPLAARALTVEDRLSAEPGALRDGETLLRQVRIRAVGTLPQSLPPRPSMREPWLITFAAPEERRTELTPDGPVTTVVWEWNLRPKTGEPGVLPAVRIPWFDTATRTVRTAEIAALPFGYASFADNQGGADRLPTSAAASALAALGAGLAAGLAVSAAGLGVRRRGAVLAALRRLSPVDPTRRAIVRAGRSGDLAAVRQAAERRLRRRAALGLAVDPAGLAPLDAALYAARPAALTPEEAARLALAATSGRTARRPPRGGRPVR